jgi:hypothetical protein
VFGSCTVPPLEAAGSMLVPITKPTVAASKTSPTTTTEGGGDSAAAHASDGAGDATPRRIS